MRSLAIGLILSALLCDSQAQVLPSKGAARPASSSASAGNGVIYFIPDSTISGSVTRGDSGFSTGLGAYPAGTTTLQDKTLVGPRGGPVMQQAMHPGNLSTQDPDEEMKSLIRAQTEAIKSLSARLQLLEQRIQLIEIKGK